MQRYAMLCYVLLLYTTLCYAMLCYVLLLYTTLCYAMLCFVIIYDAVLCYAMFCYIMVKRACHLVAMLGLFAFCLTADLTGVFCQTNVDFVQATHIVSIVIFLICTHDCEIRLHLVK